ncbi:hydantoinase/oxoprolinase family protein [Arthrobacter sp. CAU 1506]|uniref:hydantoinase/oxoprolinase family protein n=1 Tax=Arthrobacter sp. CAU 1506 TaxID=2560052 RepID=UPI0010AC3D3D|nr:hydantoinase/oxoprolinase family protein [Arthrobacter sp. CAU 1506]TJY66159.1 hydantoinase/oxoprolinase family protein [Arthrobacter sp. CAU 1506]
MAYFVGIDIGGTFTDAVLLDDSGTARLLKTPTTLHDPAIGVNNALALAEQELGLAEGTVLSQVDYFGLGTTVATNALIERKGVKTAIITTKGFRDIVLMQRGTGHWSGKELHEIMHTSRLKPQDPVVERHLIREVTERVDYKGEIITALDEAEVREQVQDLIDQDVKSIAVCLLWSFRNPAHEARIKEIIQELAPDVYLTISSEIAPVLGEYERTATTALNAYLGPAVDGYMNKLDASLRSRGLKGSLRILDSGGGVITPEQCGQTPVSVLTSGPTGGVLASAKLARRIGTPNVLTTDMGGTSFDVGMIVDYEPVVSPTQEVNGYKVLKPAVKVTAIGAGGGSIARVVGGQLQVGPESAGSMPGPVCYQRGGVEPTVTDADVVLGIIDPDYFLGGTFPLDKEGAERAVYDRIAKPLGLSVHEAAAGIKAIADHRMADLLDTLTVGQGHDPRDFHIFAYGGAGGTHCHRFGAELGVQSIIVPATATVHSAFGAVMSDLHVSAELSDPMHSASWEGAAEAIDPARLTAHFKRLEEQVTLELLASGAQSERITLQRHVEVRFRMQNKGLSVPIGPGDLTTRSVQRMLDTFVRQFAELYGEESVFLGAGVELVSMRVQAKGEMDKPRIQRVVSANAQLGHVSASRKIYLGPERGFVTADLVRGTELRPGDRIKGAAVIEHPGTTIFVGPNQSAVIDELENTVILTSEKGA